MDGSCHESPRWVSLLVAEIFYPDARFPNPVPPPPSNLHLAAEAASYPGSKIQQFQSIVNGQQMVNDPQSMVMSDQYLPQQTQQMKPQQYQQQPMVHNQQMHNLNVQNMNPMVNQQPQHFRPVSNWRANDEMSASHTMANPMTMSTPVSMTSQMAAPSTMTNPGRSRRMQRQMNENEFEKKENSVNSSESSKETSSQEPECDGVDKVGCYLIRVYYDWFLVPGSCKCWKKNSNGGSLDTLKKMFIGK